MRTMQALVKARPERGLWLEEVPVPAIGINDVLIKVLKTAICGTDVHIYQWNEWARQTIPVPMVIGHEFVGVVADLGANVHDFAVGDLVSGEGHVVCGRCRNCLAGRRHLCRNTSGVGVNRPGAFAEYLVLPVSNVWYCDRDIPLEVLACFDPLGNATHTALSFDVLGEDVLITGAGPIGCMAAALVRHAGARHVVVTDLNPTRLELARRMGATVALELDGGASLVRANVVRNRDEAPSGGALVVGLISGTNVPYGASKGWNVLQWVNPAGHFAQQRSAFEQARTGAVGGVYVSNTVDTRPIPGWNATVDNAIGITSGGGNFGPQDQTLVGLSARHQWALDDDTSLRLKAEWASSDYRPSRNSSYSAAGEAFRAEIGTALLAGNLDLAASWMRVTPDYAPMLFSGSVLGMRTVRTWGLVGRFHLHDSNRYPHNRQGLGFTGKWLFNDKHSDLSVTGSWLDQTRTSLYDVRYLPDSLGPAMPNYPVLGFSPGFIDPVFCGYASPLQYGAGSRNSFYDDLRPMEDPRGRVRDYQVAFSHSWDDPKVKVDLSYNNINWYRPTGLPASQGGSQNLVDLDSDTWGLGVTWEASKAWTLLGGLNLVQVQGHCDPAGLYNGYAERTGSTGFTNLDATQTAPYLGAQWNLGKDALLECTVSHYGTVDHVPASVTAGRASDTIGATSHPFSFEGWQIQTHFNMKF